MYPVNLTINESDSFTLHCKASGYPLPSLTWIVNSETVLENEKRAIIVQQINSYTVTSTLTILDTEPDNTGEYKCRADTTDGEFFIDSTVVNIIGWLKICIVYSVHWA